MICQRCLLRIARRQGLRIQVTQRQQQPQQQQHRPFSLSTTRTATPVPADTTITNNPRPNDRPAATSTSAAQPFSSTLTPAHDVEPPASTSKAPRVKSSVAAGTVLKGLNFMKNKQDPIALEDHEYPPWLWETLEAGRASGGEMGAEMEGDEFSKSKKERRKAAKAVRKQLLLNPEALAPKVPMYEQTIDLPTGDGTLKGSKDAGRARAALTAAMRDNRKKMVKENNFLRAMR